VVPIRALRLLVVATVALLLLAAGAACDAGDPAGDFQPATRGILLVATDLPAPGFWNGSSIDTVDGGFEYRLAQELAKRFKLELRLVDVPFDRIVAGDLGGADIALSQVTFTGARLERLALSIPYLPANTGVLVRRGDGFRDLAAARGREWTVQAATTQQEFLASTVRPTREPLAVGSVEEMLAALERGDADAALLDLPTALTIAAQSGGALEVPAQFVTGQQFVAALPRGSRNLEAVDSALRNLTAAGTLRDLEASELRPTFGGRDPADIPVILTPQPRQP
jgi:polar amino acid transport system substrate-binding protein